MSHTIASKPADCQDKAVALSERDEDNAIALLLRAAIDESGWKHDAVAATLDVDGPYLSKMLTGEKPIGARHLMRLPDDIEKIFARRYAECFDQIVIAPILDRAEAMKAFVGSVLGLMTPALPERATGMAKAEIVSEKKKRTA